MITVRARLRRGTLATIVAVSALLLVFTAPPDSAADPNPTSATHSPSSMMPSATNMSKAKADAPIHTTNASHSYYSGYGVTGHKRYVHVGASWTVPEAKCSFFDLNETQAAVWVALGGFAKKAADARLPQIGTISGCTIIGYPIYEAVWEIAGQNSVTLITGHTLHAGDQVSAIVDFAASFTTKGKFDAWFQIDVTPKSGSKWTWGNPTGLVITGADPKAIQDNAWWIVEAPVGGPAKKQVITELANFGSVKISKAQWAAEEGTQGTVRTIAGDSNIYKYSLSPKAKLPSGFTSKNTHQAIPSNLTGGMDLRTGSIFTVTYKK